MRILAWFVVALPGVLAASVGCDGRPLQYPPLGVDVVSSVEED
jgi:hypothetical protein